MGNSTSSIPRRCVVRRLAFGLVGLAALACGPAAPTPTSPPRQAEPPPVTQPPKPSPQSPKPAPTSASTAAALAPPTQAPAMPKVVQVGLIQASPNLHFSPVLIADARKFFEDEAIEVTWQQVQGGALTTAGLVSGEAQFMAASSNDVMVSVEKNLDILTVAGISASQTSVLAAGKDFIQRRGVTPQSPLRDKVLALKGSKIGTSSLSGSPTQVAKYLLKAYGLDPEADAEYVVVGQGSAAIAALREGRVDVFVQGPPTPELAEHEGSGVVYMVLPKEMPAFKDFINGILGGMRNWIEQNANVTERVCRAVGRATNLIIEDLPGAIATLQKIFSSVDRQVLDRAMDNIKVAYRPDGRMTEAMWKNAAEMYLFAGSVKQMPDTAEGRLWTNRYLVNVPRR